MEHEVVIRLRIILDIVSPSVVADANSLGGHPHDDLPADKPKTKTEVIRVCEPETAPRPLRHIRKAAAVAHVEQSLVDMGAAGESIPSAAAVQEAFAAKWEKLGGTSVQTLRLKGLLAQYGETDHTNVSPENRNAFLRALEVMQK